MNVIKLGDYDFSFRKGKSEEFIPYASIFSIRILKISARTYKMSISARDHKPIVINSLSYDTNGKEVDQSREYALLVRVLHHHLKDKSSSVFSCGGNREKIWFLALISVILSFTLSAAADYFGFRIMNPYAEACILSLFAIAVAMGLNAGNMPKTYEPSEIPLQFLP